MVFYVGRSFTSTVTGSRVVEMCCDKCRTDFFYELVRQGTGSGSAPYYIGQGSAARRAEKGAAAALAKKLKNDSELVPCPQCGWINDKLVSGYRRTRYGALKVTGVIAGSVVGVVTGFFLHDIYGESLGSWLPWILALLAVVVAAGPFWALCYWMRSRIRPNRRYPDRPILPEGTPRAWTASDLAAGAPRQTDQFVPVDPATTAFPDWVVYRAGHFVLPAVCCECLGPATTTFKSPYKLNENSEGMQPPLCEECASALRSNWWLMLLMVAAVSCWIAALVYFMSTSTDQADKVITAVFIIAIGVGVGGAIVPSRLVSPYKFRVVDPARSIYRLRFKNEQYTEMVRKLSKDAEAVSIARKVQQVGGSNI